MQWSWYNTRNGMIINEYSQKNNMCRHSINSNSKQKNTIFKLTCGLENVWRLQIPAGTHKVQDTTIVQIFKNSNGINKCANTKGFAIAENVSTITSKNTKLFLKHCVHVHNHSHTCNSYTKV